MTLFDIEVMSSAFSVPSHPHFQSNRDRKPNQLVSYPVQHSKGEPGKTLGRIPNERRQNGKHDF
jgi:hypothetical protein